MTNQEAIEDIRNNIKPIVGGKSLDMAIEALEERKTGRWIPCSERLPEEFKRVLCCTDMREMFLARVYIFDDGNYSFDDEDGMMWEGNVVAWMPLPDCYQGDGNNEKIQRRETE